MRVSSSLNRRSAPFRGRGDLDGVVLTKFAAATESAIGAKTAAYLKYNNQGVAAEEGAPQGRA